MGDERAETYLRLRAEAELRRTGELLRGLDAGDGPDGLADPGRSPFAVAERAAWRVVMAGRILVAAGALGEERLACVTADFHAAVRARSRLMLDWDRRRHMLYRGRYSRAGPPPSSRSAGGPMRVTPVGQAVEVAGGRAPATLHLMSLVRTGTEALVTVVMRMRWPPDGSSTDLEISGAGPHHLPFGQLWAADEEGTRYAVRFEAGQGGTDTWAGVAQLTPVPPDRARWLEVYGDGTRLARLPLRPPAASGRQAPPPAAGPAAVSPAERLLAVEAERILAGGGASVSAESPDPGEIVTVLTEAGVLAAGSPLPGQLAALCGRLSADADGIAVPAADEIPAEWASVLVGATCACPPPRCSPRRQSSCPDLDGARFVVAGLSTAAGESHLHVAGTGLPPPAGRPDIASRDAAERAGSDKVVAASGLAGRGHAGLRRVPPQADLHDHRNPPQSRPPLPQNSRLRSGWRRNSTRAPWYPSAAFTPYRRPTVPALARRPVWIG